MTLKIVTGLIGLVLWLFLATPFVLAEEPPIPPPKTVEQLIAHYAAFYRVSEVEMRETMLCESRLNPSAVGDGGNSYGVAQIHLPSHPTVTKEQAFDPEFAIRWTAENFSKGKQNMWTCYRILFGGVGT